MRNYLGLAGLIILSTSYCQTTDFPLNHLVYQVIDSKEIQSELSFSSTIKPYARDAVHYLIDANGGSYLDKELRDFTYDSTYSKRPFLKKLYQYPADFYYHQDKSILLHVNPAVQFSVGRSNDIIGTTFINSRGVEIRGRVDNKISFYTYLTENQARYPEYVNNVRDSTLAIPYEGFWKQYNETGVDFFRAQGYVDFGISKSISAQLGFGKHFIGNGYRSLVLSDFANNYPYFRINTQNKLFDYTNIFAEMIAEVDGGAFGLLGTGSFTKKYMAFHHLNIKIKPNFHIGFFESVMYGDSTGGLKVEYMNPVIFYRSVEQQNGSADNAFVGMDFKWNIKNRFSLYGQLMIDEMIVSEVFAGDGWWGNKQGVQLGLKYTDALGVEGLLFQGEYNRVRPYTYAHENGFTSYSHYNQALAHPLGANFTEIVGRFRYRWGEKWNFEAAVVIAQYGNDIGDENFGRDILKNYTVRRSDGNGRSLEFGNDHLQGNKTELAVLFGRVSYMIKHNAFIDLDVTYRNESDEVGFINANHGVVGASFRWNIPTRDYLF